MPSNSAQWATFALLTGLSILIVLWDVSIALHAGPSATISKVARRLFTHFPILFPIFWFWLGVLAGHIGLPVE
jgi:hypothetical protein